MYLKRSIYSKFLEWKNEKSKKVLLVEGARQVGKTYLSKKFAYENFEKVIYINLLEDSGLRLLSCYDDIQKNIKEGKIDTTDKSYNCAEELFKRYSKKFVNSKESIIIIDEIQESSKIFNKIRNFARDLNCYVIVTGSYLGRTILEKEFWYSAGDYETLEITPLSFEEFLESQGSFDEYKKLDLYGKSSKEDYERIENLFKSYLYIGGFPAIVEEYLTTKNVQKCYSLLGEIIDIYCKESSSYFSEIDNKLIFSQTLSEICRMLLKEKKGLGGVALNEYLYKEFSKNGDTSISKRVCTRVLSWLLTSKMFSYCGKAVECDLLSVSENQRCYLSDNGILNYLLLQVGADRATRKGILYENYVFNFLNNKFIARPNFGTLGNGELDFILRSPIDECIYGIEVKSGKNSGKTITTALKKKKIDYAIYAKGNTYGGIDEKIYTIPIYLLEKFNFDLGGVIEDIF